MKRCPSCGHSPAAHLGGMRCALCGCTPRRQTLVQEKLAFRSALPARAVGSSGKKAS